MSLINQYKEMHKDESLYADSVIGLHKQSIRQGLEITGSKTILDYGCGKATQYTIDKVHEECFFGILPELYDPGVKEFSKLPKDKFDAVISTDVLEHIEEDDLDATLKQIFSKANKFVYLGICNIPAETFLPDGRNAHVTLKDFDWWLGKITPLSNVFTMVYVYGEHGSSGKAILTNGKVTNKKKR